jgi:probable rRNA maturation factor
VPAVPIHFQTEDAISFSLEDKKAIVAWIDGIIKQQGKKRGELLYFFCTDSYLLKVNKKFLKHDTYTDIITFDYSEGNKIEGEIYISIERVKENAATYKQPFNKELARTLIHGVLHLCGHTDKTAVAKKKIRQLEDDALRMLRVK